MNSQFLYVGDVAQKYGISKSRARAWLVELEAKYGKTVVGRRGRRIYTTESALVAAGPLIETANLSAILHEVMERIKRLERRARIR